MGLPFVIFLQEKLITIAFAVKVNLTRKVFPVQTLSSGLMQVNLQQQGRTGMTNLEMVIMECTTGGSPSVVTNAQNGLSHALHR